MGKHVSSFSAKQAFVQIETFWLPQVRGRVPGLVLVVGAGDWPEDSDCQLRIAAHGSRRLSKIHDSRSIHRLLATSCAVLVFTLGLFAASPLLHEQLHSAASMPSDDGCAVALFATGVSTLLTVQALPLPSAEWREQPYVRAIEVSLDSPRYRLQPGRGPPFA